MEIDYRSNRTKNKNSTHKKGTTQEAIADIIDITPAHMSNVETGKTKVSLPTLIAIANALSISVDTLLFAELLKSSKDIVRKDRKLRNQLEKKNRSL